MSAKKQNIMSKTKCNQKYQEKAPASFGLEVSFG